MPQEGREELPLSKAAEFLLDECRMVLPGIQALFGFQLIAVFNSGFSEKLTPFEQRIHLLAIVLVAIAVALIMTPAALHRASGATAVHETVLRLSSRLLRCSMAPLAISISLEFYLIARIITESQLVPVIAGALFTIFVFLWYVLPLSKSLQSLAGAR
jgi:hypothetical protein